MSSSHPITCDFLVVGAGIIGINIALSLRKKHPKAHIILLEKENEPGLHASGRNSGVLHAGFYYTKDSLKAAFSKAGNAALTAFCLERNLPINQCGKLVVARDENDLAGLHELHRRGKENDIALHLISQQEALAIEPRVKTHEYALFSPTTASVDPKIIVTTLVQDLKKANIPLHCHEHFLKKTRHLIQTSKAHYAPGYVVNAAGLYADKIAKQFGFAEQYEILPFKGLYLYGATTEKLRTHIYPVPNLNNPFLGVHFTLNAQGNVKIGPTAIPAFWREHYTGFENFKLQETAAIMLRQMGLLLNANFNFRQLAITELKKYNRKVLVNQASTLATHTLPQHYTQWGKPGIRAQLIDIKNKKLEMDFIVAGDAHSFHVLNAVSPAFTCAMPFAAHVTDLISKETT